MTIGVIILSYVKFLTPEDFKLLALMVFSAYFGSKIPKVEN